MSLRTVDDSAEGVGETRPHATSSADDDGVLRLDDLEVRDLVYSVLDTKLCVLLPHVVTGLCTVHHTYTHYYYYTATISTFLERYGPSSSTT